MDAENFSFDPLPEGFMLPKPVNSVKDKTVLELERRGRLAITRKRNGYRIWAAKSHATNLFTRGLNEVTRRFPNVAKELEAIMPPHSFLDGEMVLERDGKDELVTVERFFKAGTPKEVLRLYDEIGSPRFMIFDIIFWNGKKWISKPWRERYAKISQILRELPFQHVFPVELVACSFEDAQKLMIEREWEGLVLYDTEGCSDFRLDGKVARPQVAWKRKPVYEDDFIVRRWIPRKSNQNLVKEFILSQIDPETGKEIDCGKCGSGLKNTQRIEFANDILYPLVVEVKFYDRFPSGKLQFASIVRVRDDKKPEECLFIKETD